MTFTDICIYLLANVLLMQVAGTLYLAQGTQSVRRTFIDIGILLCIHSEFVDLIGADSWPTINTYICKVQYGPFLFVSDDDVDAGIAVSENLPRTGFWYCLNPFRCVP